MKCLVITVALFGVVFGANVPNVKLNSGHDMPIIGLGTWKAGGSDVVNAVRDALEIGYRHIDTANVYGNEKQVGEGLAAAIKAGFVKREDVFITTKHMPDKSGRTKALADVHNSLKEMGVEYLDLVLIHRPFDDYVGAYKALEELVGEGKIKSIGISNFNPQEIDKLYASGIKIHPANNQIEIHPKMNQDETIDHSKKLNISVTSWGSLGEGQFSLTDPLFVDIGKAHNKSAVQVLLRYELDRGLIIIPKSVNKAHIQENFNVFDFTLTSDEITKLHSMK